MPPRSAGLATLIKPIHRQACCRTSRADRLGVPIDLRPEPSSGVYLVKGLGAYFSGYLMTDVGQRVVRDLRNQLYRHILGSVGRLLRAAHHRRS